MIPCVLPFRQVKTLLILGSLGLAFWEGAELDAAEYQVLPVTGEGELVSSYAYALNDEGVIVGQATFLVRPTTGQPYQTSSGYRWIPSGGGLWTENHSYLINYDINNQGLTAPGDTPAFESTYSESYNEAGLVTASSNYGDGYALALNDHGLWVGSYYSYNSIYEYTDRPNSPDGEENPMELSLESTDRRTSPGFLRQGGSFLRIAGSSDVSSYTIFVRWPVTYLLTERVQEHPVTLGMAVAYGVDNLGYAIGQDLEGVGLWKVEGEGAGRIALTGADIYLMHIAPNSGGGGGEERGETCCLAGTWARESSAFHSAGSYRHGTIRPRLCLMQQ
ncbi:MAG: hypothetical protein HC904_01595 [Blastochloris sp.]|nr:hypothetical protein [Blastochloris sp.]